MPQEISELLVEIERAVEKDEGERRTASSAGLAAARALAATMPLVHRTGRRDKNPPWTEILKGRAFRASPSVTEEEEGCGWPPSVYFFLGVAAYPKGSIAFLLEQDALGSQAGTFSAFDSGALSRGHIVPRDTTLPWSLDDRIRHLDRHSGSVTAVRDFAGPYIASHFRDPSSYVSLPQESEPDFDAYHGLRSTNGDRRAWTIEVRLHGDVPVSPGRDKLRAIVLANRALESDVPDDFVDRIVVAEADADSDGDVAWTTASLVLTGGAS